MTVAEVMQPRLNLLGLDPQSLSQRCVEMGEKPFRARQLLKWIHHQGIDDFEAMTDISRKFRAQLQNRCEVRGLGVQFEGISRDGTVKWLFALDGGNAIETVFIPDNGRGTLCISTQVGCALDCSFCSTARQGFNRNLSTAEIVGQVWTATQRLLALGLPDNRITNVVVMGMGEPLANYANLVPALRVMMDDLGYGLSKRKVTVSTSGIVPAMDRLREAVDVALAVSLHAPDDALRDELVPLNRKYPLAMLLDACRRWVDERDRKTHIMFEYVMLRGVNDRPEQAHAMVRLLRGIPCKINLIPFNPFPGSGYRVSTDADIDRFWEILNAAGYRTTKRRTRGDDIDAACGQLAGQVQDKSRRAQRFSAPRFGESR